MNVDDIINNTILKEGDKYTNDLSDSGGPTRYGITLNTLSLALHHPATADMVKALTEDQAKIIYKNLYYYGPRINLLPEAVQPAVYDFGVNAGTGVAIESLQTVCKMFGYEILEDGLMGPATEAVVAKAYAEKGGYLINAYEDYRNWFYEKLAERLPKDHKYLKGWETRANSFRVVV